MKKYARLRSTSSLDPEQCEPGHGGKLEGASTILSLDEDDEVDARAPGKWNGLKLSPPVLQGSKHDRGGDVSSSSSHRVLAEALKKLSSLKETHHDIDDPRPRGVMSATHSWGARIVSDSDVGGGEPHSTFFSGDWLGPRSAMGADLQGSSYRSGSNGDAVSAVAQEIIRTESSCTHTSHFTHRRSSSLHDGTTLGGQPSAARPSATSMAAMAINGLHARQPGIKAGFVPCFQDDSEQWLPPPPRINSTITSTSGASAAAPSARRVPMVAANSPRQAKSCSLWEESDDPKGWGQEGSAAKRAGAVQSMRYDRLQSSGTGAGLREKELQSQSVREGAAHAQAIAAMARAYAEKYGVAQAVVECVSCGRGLGIIVEGTSPGSYDSSFCRACRPPVLPAATATAAPASTSWKKGASGVSRGMMHYCRKLLLRMGKKPAHKYTMV